MLNLQRLSGFRKHPYIYFDMLKTLAVFFIEALQQYIGLSKGKYPDVKVVEHYYSGLDFVIMAMKLINVYCLFKYK